MLTEEQMTQFFQDQAMTEIVYDSNMTVTKIRQENGHGVRTRVTRLYTEFQNVVDTGILIGKHTVQSKRVSQSAILVGNVGTVVGSLK